MFDFQHRNIIVRRPTASFTVRPVDTIILPDATSGAIVATLFDEGGKRDITLLIQQTGATSNTVTINTNAGVTVATLTGQNSGVLLQLSDDGTWIVASSSLGGISSLARGFIIVGGASGPTTLDANNSGQILVGDGTDLNSVAVSGDVTLSSTGVTTIGAAKVTRAQMSAPAGSQAVQRVGGTIATTSTTDEYIVVPQAGSLTSAFVTPLVALTANDTNYITWTIVNLGQAGAGSTAMLAATAPNTTQATGGTGLSINTLRTLTVHGTAANLVVAANDLLLIRATATGTLANTVTRPIYQLKFSGTT